MSRLFMINKSYTGTYQSFERDLIIAMPLCPPTAKYPQLMYINVGMQAWMMRYIHIPGI